MPFPLSADRNTHRRSDAAAHHGPHKAKRKLLPGEDRTHVGHIHSLPSVPQTAYPPPADPPFKGQDFAEICAKRTSPQSKKPGSREMRDDPPQDG